jgi:Cu/Ag efflux pump CusA
VVVLGGLVSSTFLNLFVVPVGYALAFGRAGTSIAAAEPEVVPA